MPTRRQPPIASTVVAWVLFLVAFSLTIVMLFQNPGRRAYRAGAPPPTAPEPTERR